VVLGDVLGGVAQQKAQVRLAFEADGTHHDALNVTTQSVKGPTRVGQQELEGLALGQLLAPVLDETLDEGCVGLVHFGTGLSGGRLAHACVSGLLASGAALAGASVAALADAAAAAGA
jgi:hypothetical protein